MSSSSSNTPFPGFSLWPNVLWSEPCRCHTLITWPS
jgi:hypothetical protein